MFGDMGGAPGGDMGAPPGGEQQAGFGIRSGMGGQVSGRGELPLGAAPREQFTVNQVRALLGIDPVEGEDGSMTLVEYKAKMTNGRSNV